MTSSTLTTRLKGGEFLVKDSAYSDLFISEDFNEEQKMIAETVKSFIETELYPFNDRIEALEDGLMPSKLEAFAELGFLGTQMPEEFGGSNLDCITNTIIAEEIGPAGAFSVPYNAHTGIGMLPILYFGNETQKAKYLPKLITGAFKSAYCLTEPSSGSDALSAKTTAFLNDEGTHYILNGQKMWITNAGFADIFTVFAQVEGDKFSAFILEKGMPGLTLGAEEKKMGIKGSSTRQVFFENVKVPKENLLGEIGKGHLIAFNVLNTGRFKLGVSCLGGCKRVLAEGVKYAKQREQFKQPIASFGAIKFKIAEQAIRTFVLDATVYRTAQLIQSAEEAFKEEGMDFANSKRQAAHEYAIECAIIKILGSEVLDYVVDETVQIFGGMGYSEEGLIAKAYRDARINRIFEGTNEINRLLILSSIFKNAMNGTLDLMTPGMQVQNELMNGVESTRSFDGDYALEWQTLANFKKALIMLLGTSAQLAMGGKLDIKEEQEILMNLSDIIIDIYGVESTLMRVNKIKDNFNNRDNAVYDAILRTLMHDKASSIYKNGLDAVASMVDMEMQGPLIAGLRKFTKYPLQNVKELRRIIANEVINQEAVI